MKTLRRLSIAALFALGLSNAVAQAPPVVPALPDTPRLTSYTIAGTTCACAVNFALYGNANLADYYDWVEVFLNGVQVAYNDPTYGWTITSPTGALASIARPITDAVLTFTNVQTGNVQIVGAARPSRLSQWSENQGVSARNLNVAFTGLVAQLREVWDKINDVSGRDLKSQPGNTVGLLPLPAACSNAFLGFDATGLNPLCRVGAGSGNVVGPATSTVNHLAAFGNVTGSALLDIALGTHLSIGSSTLSTDATGTGVLATKGDIGVALPSLTTSQLYGGTGAPGVAQAFPLGTGLSALLQQPPNATGGLVGYGGSMGNVTGHASLDLPLTGGTINGTLDINPTPSTLNMGVFVTQTGPITGSTTNLENFNEIIVTGDASAITGGAGEQASALYLNYGYGGSNAQGPKSALTIISHLDNSPSSSDTASYYTGILLNQSTAANANGAIGTPSGTNEGAEIIAALKSGATYYQSLVGLELDVRILAGASATQRTGLSLNSDGNLAASSDDDAIEISTVSGSPSWGNGIRLSNTAGAAPIATTGCILCTDGSPNTVAFGIDLSAYTFTGLFLKGPGGFQVNSAGSLSAPYVTSAGPVLSYNPTGGIGYEAGAGGTIGQSSSKSTGVTLNKVTGAITMNNASLAAGTIVSFVLTDSAIAATDTLVLNHISGGTVGSYTLNAQAAAGSATINVRNNTAGALGEALVIEFTVIKGATS